MKPKLMLQATVLFAALTFSLAPVAFAGHKGAVPRALFEHKVYKFPAVIAGTNVTHRFDILNKGDADLDILGVYSK